MIRKFLSWLFQPHPPHPDGNLPETPRTQEEGLTALFFYAIVPEMSGETKMNVLLLRRNSYSKQIHEVSHSYYPATVTLQPYLADPVDRQQHAVELHIGTQFHPSSRDQYLLVLDRAGIIALRNELQTALDDLEIIEKHGVGAVDPQKLDSIYTK